MSQDLTARFITDFKEWAASASDEWSLPAANQEFFDAALARIPEAVQMWVAKGVVDGIVDPNGHKFTLKGLSDKKGPYDWFSNYKTAGKLGVNWEWFIHAAEYVRLFSVGQPEGMRLEFEDDLMDCSIYRNEQLIVCIEIKEKAGQLRELVAELRKLGSAAEFPEEDRHNDPLRKAKYIAKHRPRYFTGVAPGLRETFRVEYPEGVAFKLVRDLLPPL